MTVLLDLETMPVWESVRDTLGELSDSGNRFEDFANRHLDTLDELRLELEARERVLTEHEAEVERAQAELEREWQRLDALRRSAEQGAHQVQHEARRLAKLQAELEGDRKTVAGQASQATVEAWSEERLAMLRELAALREQAARLTELAAEVVAARGDLARARAQAARLQQRLAVARGHIQPNLGVQLRQLETERGRLLAELEQARQTVAGHTADERALWLEELGALRGAVERRIERLETTSRHETPLAAASLSIAGGDPVLDLVIAQFEQIEKDMQRSTGSRSPPRGRR